MKITNLTLLLFLFSLSITSCKEEGCTDAVADNYNVEADEDDGSCQYGGCTDETAVNYSELANVDDGSCEYAGCNDPQAVNYDPEAAASDGSCLFEGRFVFWWSEGTAQSMTNQNINSLALYFEDNLVETYDTSPFWSAAPSCTETSAMAHLKDLGPAKTISVDYRFTEPNSGQDIFKGIITFGADSCKSVELVR